MGSLLGFRGQPVGPRSSIREPCQVASLFPRLTHWLQTYSFQLTGRRGLDRSPATGETPFGSRAFPRLGYPVSGHTTCVPASICRTLPSSNRCEPPAGKELDRFLASRRRSLTRPDRRHLAASIKQMAWNRMACPTRTGWQPRWKGRRPWALKRSVFLPMR